MWSDPVVIIGASLAGAATAATLARMGVRAIVIDKGRFPRRKPCGEGLSARGRAELDDIGFSLATTGCSHLSLDGYSIHRADRTLHIPSHSGLIAVERYQLDWKLLQYALGLGHVELIQGEVPQVSRDSCGVFTVRLKGRTISTRLLVAADGAQSSTVRALSEGSAVYRTDRLGSSSQWQIIKGSLAPRVHLFLMQGGEIYLTPLPHSRVNISVLGGVALVQPFAHLRRLASQVELLSRYLKLSLEPTEVPLSSGAIGSLHRGAQCRGAFVVGDACETFDPCAGFGMTHALISGKLAGKHILKALSASNISNELHEYERNRYDQTRDLRGFTKLTSMTFATKMGRVALPFLVSSGVAGTVSSAIHSHASYSRRCRAISWLGH
jgi:flavin-dependent dehydrogenase